MSASSTGISTPFNGVVTTPDSIDQSIDGSREEGFFFLRYEESQVFFTVPSVIVETLNRNRRDFLQSLSSLEATDESIPETSVSLALQYIKFLLDSDVSIPVIRCLLQAFDREFCCAVEIHSLLSDPAYTSSTRSKILKTYYEAHSVCSTVPQSGSSALLKAAKTGNARLFIAFGGQGTANPVCVEELSRLHNVYRPFLEDLIEAIAPTLSSLSRLPETRDHYHGRYLDITTWLGDPSSVPGQDFLSTAAASFPIIGLLSLAQYCVVCKILGCTPGEVRYLLNGVTGHSQGIIIAAAIAASDSWESFFETAKYVVEILFWIGYESHRQAPRTSLYPALVNECLEHTEGRPSCLLSVRGLGRNKIDAKVDEVNKSLPLDGKLFVALANTRDNFVVAGPAKSLLSLSSRLRDARAGDVDQSRIPFSRRKPTIHHQFLPVSAPFHTQYLKKASADVKTRLAGRGEFLSDLAIPVYHGKDGSDLRTPQNHDLTGVLIDAVMCETVNWPAALDFPDASHIITFGGGRFEELVARNRDGWGVRIISGSELYSSNKNIGTKEELFAVQLPDSSLNTPSWKEQFQPGLIQNCSGNFVLDTKLSRLLGAPPVIVAGMTPTTVPWDFAAAVMNAGYHVELAGGGYYSDESMSTAIAKIVASVPPGRGITCNFIYASPQAMAWQIPMVRRLVQNNVPIDGLTIGAGIPSAEIISSWAETLGLKHISLKPGSHAGILNVIEIAKAHPTFPFILQWTGGRGGGHHSFEDFHAPIISLYSQIRSQSNIVLAAGSGFGAAEDMYPYFTGSWSTQFGLAPMPFDGVLLGSRMMVAKEAHTSPQAKKLIVEAPGVQDVKWEDSYDKPTGGIITVISEMGEPIHKIATRGVLLWAELDKIIFNLPRPQRVAALNQRKDCIIQLLNEDYAKPWFGLDSDGKVVEISEMTYAEVLTRLVSLMYISHKKRWINNSYRELVRDFASRTLERLPGDLDITTSMLEDPQNFLASFTEACPRAKTQVLHPEDHVFFIQRCKARGQKPVNFIPALDEDFEYWFKKDSLWQSEDVDAVIDQDAGRVCILHGPVAAAYSRKVDEPAKDILDGISNGLVAMVKSDHSSGEVSLARQESAAVPSAVDFPYILEDAPAWMCQIFSDEYLLQGCARKSNPFPRIIRSSGGKDFKLERQGSTCTIEVEKPAGIKSCLQVTHNNDRSISVNLQEPSHYGDHHVSLPLRFNLDTSKTFCGLSEVMEGRNDRIKSFYSNLWLNRDITEDIGIDSTFSGEEITLTNTMLQEMTSTIGHSFAHDELSDSSSDIFPINYSMIVAWDVMVKPLLVKEIDGDLLQLVHHSSGFEYVKGASPLRVGDALKAQSRIQAVYIKDAGKYVDVKAEIEREGKPAVVVTSTFLFRGDFDDYTSTFRETEEPEMILVVKSAQDAAILRDREWFHPSDSSMELVGKTLSFRLHTKVVWKDKAKFQSLSVEGEVLASLPGQRLQHIGIVNFAASDCAENPIMEFLHRKGSPSIIRTDLSAPGWSGDSSMNLKLPSSNEIYARISKDYNPIHVSPIFATWANLPNTIVHGMYTSAVSAAVLQYLATDGDSLRMKKFTSAFTGMVLPSDELTVRIKHIAMVQGRMIFSVVAYRKDSDEKVLEGEAEIEQAETVYIFTGQGSQAKGMGMELYEKSPVARSIWDDIDQYLFDSWGWSILHIIRQNPKTLKIHFHGSHGRQIRSNYLSLNTTLKNLTSNSTSYTFNEPQGLLYSTQFAQPAIILLQKATFEDMRANGLVQENASFAGHSLGEWGALSAVAEFMGLRAFMDLVFYRGLMMQNVMVRDEVGRTGFAMVAVNPARVGKFFNDEALEVVVGMIAKESGELLEIVNFNVRGEQYVCAGTLRNLHILHLLLDHLTNTPSAQHPITASTLLTPLIMHHLSQTSTPPTLSRGRATIPLQGIDVPFHSTHLRSGVPAFREFFKQRLDRETLDWGKLVGKWVPNVVGRPFELSRGFVDEVGRRTGSQVGRLLGKEAVMGV